jgi:hypothetical protein
MDFPLLCSAVLSVYWFCRCASRSLPLIAAMLSSSRCLVVWASIWFQSVALALWCPAVFLGNIRLLNWVVDITILRLRVWRWSWDSGWIFRKKFEAPIHPLPLWSPFSVLRCPMQKWYGDSEGPWLYVHETKEKWFEVTLIRWKTKYIFTSVQQCPYLYTWNAVQQQDSKHWAHLTWSLHRTQATIIPLSASRFPRRAPYAW